MPIEIFTSFYLITLILVLLHLLHFDAQLSLFILENVLSASSMSQFFLYFFLIPFLLFLFFFSLETWIASRKTSYLEYLDIFSHLFSFHTLFLFFFLLQFPHSTSSRFKFQNKTKPARMPDDSAGRSRATDPSNFSWSNQKNPHSDGLIELS